MKRDMVLASVGLRPEFRDDVHYSLDAPSTMPAGSTERDLFKVVTQTLALREGRLATHAEQQENLKAIIERLQGARKERT